MIPPESEEKENITQAILDMFIDSNVHPSDFMSQLCLALMTLCEKGKMSPGQFKEYLQFICITYSKIYQKEDK